MVAFPINIRTKICTKICTKIFSRFSDLTNVVQKYFKILCAFNIRCWNEWVLLDENHIHWENLFVQENFLQILLLLRPKMNV